MSDREQARIRGITRECRVYVSVRIREIGRRYTALFLEIKHEWKERIADFVTLSLAWLLLFPRVYEILEKNAREQNGKRAPLTPIPDRCFEEDKTRFHDRGAGAPGWFRNIVLQYRDGGK